MCIRDRCNSENIIKIGPYLPKLLQEKFGAVFLAHPVHTASHKKTRGLFDNVLQMG